MFRGKGLCCGEELVCTIPHKKYFLLILQDGTVDKSRVDGDWDQDEC